MRLLRRSVFLLQATVLVAISDFAIGDLASSQNSFPSAGINVRRTGTRRDDRPRYEMLDDDAELILSYKPTYNVKSVLNIDLDLELLSLSLDSSVDEAYKIYELGGFARSYARVRTSQQNILSNVWVTGKSSEGVTICAVLGQRRPFRNIPDEEFLHVEYVPNNDGTGCYVGGLPSPIRDKCLQNKGKLIVGGACNPSETNQKEIDYSYNPEKENLNALAFGKMHLGENDQIYDEFSKFTDYYGGSTYSNEIVNGSFFKKKVTFTNGRVIDFEHLGDGADKNMILSTIRSLPLTNEIIQMLYQSLDFCNNKCQDTQETSSLEDCKDHALRALDTAVALYTGSKVVANESGYLLYSSAEELCQTFGTCDSTTAKVNSNIFGYFDGLRKLYTNPVDSNCLSAIELKDAIVSSLRIPLIQEFLHFSYYAEFHGKKKSLQMKGLASFAVLVPLIHSCNETDASLLYNHVHPWRGGGNGFFAPVKDILERNYNCMGIRCSDIGGIVSSNGGYRDFAQPCNDEGTIGNVVPTPAFPLPPNEPPAILPPNSLGENNDVGSSMTDNYTNDAGPARPGLAVSVTIVTLLVLMFATYRVRQRLRRESQGKDEEIFRFGPNDNLASSQVIL